MAFSVSGAVLPPHHPSVQGAHPSTVQTETIACAKRRYGETSVYGVLLCMATQGCTADPRDAPIKSQFISPQRCECS